MASSSSPAEHFQSNATPIVFPRPFERVDKQTRLSLPGVGEGVEGECVGEGGEGWGDCSLTHTHIGPFHLCCEKDLHFFLVMEMEMEGVDQRETWLFFPGLFAFGFW